jgi:tetratricopeptide (TPR) repeat protein
VLDGGKWKWVSRSLDIRIPDTIQGLLLSRLDLLPPLEKRVIQDASVVGRHFWPGAIHAIDTLTPEETGAALARLVERDLIEQRPVSALAGEPEFGFTHALIREVAYSTLPKTARSEHHRRLASWLADAAPAHGEELLEILAHHLEQAWRYRLETGEHADELARDAVAALRRAAKRATALGTLPEARHLYERALTIVRGAGLIDDATLYAELLTDHSDVVKWMSAPATVFASTETVLHLAQQIGRDDLLARAWLNRAFAEYDKNNLEAAESALQKALELFRRLADRQGEAEAYELLGIITHSLRGRLSKAQTAYRKALDLYQAMGDGKGTARTTAFLGRALLDTGELAHAKPRLLDALGLARTHHERISEARSLVGLAIVEHLAGDPSACVSNFTGAIAIWRELGDAVGEAYTHRHLGMHLLRRGKVEEAEREIQTARRLLREHGAVEDSPFLLRSLAEISLAKGDLVRAAEYAEQCVAGLTDQDVIQKSTHRVTLGRVRAVQGRFQEAESLFAQSLEILSQENQEYRFDLAVSLLKYGEALQVMQRPQPAREALQQARSLFAQMGASNFVREVDARLELVRA